MLLLSCVMVIIAAGNSLAAQYSESQSEVAHIGQLDLADRGNGLSYVLQAQIGSAGSLDLDASERSMLDGFLAWSPAFREDCLNGTVTADTELLGADLLSLAVVLDNADAVETLLDSYPRTLEQLRLDRLLVSALHSGNDGMAALLAGRGALLGSGVAGEMLQRPGGIDPELLGRLLEVGKPSTDPAEWTAFISRIVPVASTEQLSRLLEAGTHWDYSSAGDELLGACLSDAAKLKLLSSNGFDVARYAAAGSRQPLVSICRAYRGQRRSLEMRAPLLGAARLELSRRALAMTTTELLEKLQREGALKGLLDERLKELDQLTGEEYAVCTAIDDLRYFQMLRRMGLDLNATDGDGNNALNLLLLNGLLSDKELQELSQLGIDPLHENFLSRSALHIAILNGRDELATAWLAKAQSPQPVALVALGRVAEFNDAVAKLGLTEEQANRELEKGMLLAGQAGNKAALKAVIASGRAPLMQALVMLGMDSELGKAFFDQELLISENLTVDSSLTVAVKRQNLDLLEFLFSVLPHDQHWLEEAQDQALMEAAKLEDRRFLQALLDYGTPVERRSSAGMTALVSACSAGRIDNVRYLLQLGADPGRGLDYFATQGRAAGTELMPDAERSRQNQAVLKVLLAIYNPEHPGLSDAWTGRDDMLPDLLGTIVCWPGVERELVAQVAELSTPDALLGAMACCIDLDRSDLLAALAGQEGTELSPERQQELLARALRGGSVDCIAVLLETGLNVPGPRETVKLLGMDD